MARIDSKNALPTYGRLFVDITFEIVEQTGTFHSDGTSKYYKNVLAHKKKMLDDAIYNAIKRKFAARTVTPFNIVILYYTYTYYIYKYEIIEKEGKMYEKFRDAENKRTKYYIIDKKKILPPDVAYGGIYKKNRSPYTKKAIENAKKKRDVENN